MLWTRWFAVLLMAACATPEGEAPPPPAVPAAPPSPTAAPRTPQAAICAKASGRIGITLDGNTAFLKLNELEAAERKLFWNVDLAANVHVLAVSDRPPKGCDILED